MCTSLLRPEEEDPLAIETREARFRLLVEVTNTLVWVMSAAGRFVEPQPSLVAFTGLTDEQIAGDGWTRALHPDDVERVAHEWKEHVEQQVPAELVYRLRRHDGEYRLMRARAIPRFDTAGGLLEWVGANEDVTDSQRESVASKERERRLQDFADVLPHIAWESDETGAVIWLNARFYEFTGLKVGEALLWSWTDRFHPDDIAGYLAAWRDVVAAGTVFRYEARMLRYDGVMRWMRFGAEARTDQNGRTDRWYGTATDIEDSYRATERIHEFIATLSHELRNPLAPIRNGLHALRSAPFPDTAKPVFAMLDRQVTHMVRLIDDLMDFNRIAGDKLILRLEPSELQVEIRNAVESCQSVLLSGNHALHLVLPDQPLRVLADRTRLSQIFVNLLVNAAKFSPPSSPIRMVARERAGQAVVEVEDFGMGIDPGRLEEVFQMFSQVGPNSTGQLGGLGIGLTIARRLVEMHGGSIRAHSEGAGRGCRFTVVLPFLSETAPIAESQLPRSTQATDAPRRVLIVDDNRDAADSLVMIAQHLGHEARSAYDGEQALHVAAGFLPDVAVVDIGLPDISGYEVASRLRAAMRDRNLVLVALTGWGQERDRQRSVEAGFDGHLVKPVEMPLLEKILNGTEGGLPNPFE